MSAILAVQRGATGMVVAHAGYHASLGTHAPGGTHSQHFAPRRPQPLVDYIGLHPFPKLNRSLGVCIHAMAESRHLEAPLPRRGQASLRKRPKC